MSLGTISQAKHDGNIFVNASSNDVIFTTKTLDQRIMFGFSSNYSSVISLGKSNVVYGTPHSNLDIKQWGDLDVHNNITSSNMFVKNKLGIGSNVVLVDPNLSVYVEGDARVNGNLIVNGNIESIDTNVTVTDEFLVVNNGTGAALQVVQNGVTPVVAFAQSNDTKLLLTADGRLLVGSNVTLPQSPYDGMRVSIQGGLNVSNILGVSATLSNVTTTDAYFTNLYMGNKHIIGSSGIITNSNYIPTLDTSKISFGTFTSNFIENYNVISQKLASNLTIAGTTCFDGRIGIGMCNLNNLINLNQDVKLQVMGGDVVVTGPNDFRSSGDQARLYFGSNNAYFIGGACNVGIVMQVPNTIYPFVLEENTGFLGLGVMDPEERLHVRENAKIGSRLHVTSNITVGSGTSNPDATLSVSGNVSLSNIGTLVTLWTSNNNLGINSSNPTATLHVRNRTPNDSFYVDNAGAPSFIIKPSGDTGIGIIAPSESLDVHRNIKVNSNLYALSRIAVGNSNPQFSIDAYGDARVKKNIHIDDGGAISLLYQGNTAETLENGRWTMQCYTACNYFGIQQQGSNPNVIISDQGFMRVGDVSQSRADERLHVSQGHAKFDCNVYIRGRLGVGTSNPLYDIDVVGDINLSGVIKQGAGSATFGSNVIVVNNLGIGTSNPTEKIEVVDGNVKTSSNIYIFGRLGVNTSNPQVAVDIKTTDAVALPSGTTLQRPQAPLLGYVRYNTSISTFEGFGAGNAWGSLGGVKDTNQDTYISAESFPTSNDDVLRFFNSNVNTMTISMCNITMRPETITVQRVNGLPTLVGLNTDTPESALDIIGDMRVQNVLQTSNNRLGIRTNNPLFSLHVNTNDAVCIPLGSIQERPQNPLQGCIRYNTTYHTFEGFGAGNAWGSLGGVKDTNQDTYISAESFPTSNDDIIRIYNSNVETMRVAANGFVGVGTSNPSERFDVNLGNSKFNSNVYISHRVGINTSNPLVSIHVNTTDSLALPSGTTNQRPVSPALGYIRYNTSFQTFEGFGAGNAWGSLGGVKDTNQDTYISAESFPSSNDDIIRFFNSNVETARIMPSGFVGINTSNPTERLDIRNGNAKFGSNVYVMERLGIGLSNPQQSVHVVGNIRASNGSLGPMLMLIPPFAYTDISVGQRLVLDNTLEAGNEAGSNVLFFGPGFIYQDTSDDNMQWREARLVFRGTSQTVLDNTTTGLQIQEWSQASGGYTSLSPTFTITSRQTQRGYLTYSTPWFVMSSSLERHLAILVVSSSENVAFRFGSVYIQFRA